MPKQALKVCISLFIVVSLLANYRVSAEKSGKSNAPAATDSKSKSLSPESLPVLPNPESSTTEAEALSPTFDLSVSPSTNVSDVGTKSDETVVPDQENVPSLQTEENLPQELATSPSVNDPAATISLSPSNVDSSVLDTRDMDNNLSEGNVSVSLSKEADPPALATNQTSEPDFFQENTSLPPSTTVEAPSAENVSQENLPLPDQTKDNNNPISEEVAAVPSSDSPTLDVPAPTYVQTTPALDASDDGSFTQETQSPLASVNAPAPETSVGQEINTEVNYPSATPPNTESQNPENVPQLDDFSSLPKSPAPAPSEPASFPETETTQETYPSATPPYVETQNPETVPQLNDYSNLPKSAVPAPSETFSSFPESIPTGEVTPSSSNDGTFGLTPTSQNPILPSNYRAEDEPVEPYYDDEDSSIGVNGAVAGVLASICIVGVGGFLYQKKKNDNIRAQYTCLAKKGGV